MGDGLKRAVAATKATRKVDTTMYLQVAKRRKKMGDCPVGLFLWGGTLCLKTGYVDDGDQLETHVVSSGRSLWTTFPKLLENQPVGHDSELKVFPVKVIS